MHKPPKPLTPAFRLFGLENATVQLALSHLANAPKSSEEASYNALMLTEYGHVLDQLRQLDSVQLSDLADKCLSLVNITINLDELHTAVSAMQYQEQRYRNQIRDTEWLIKNKASNQQILSLCSLITTEDIKHLRLNLSMPAIKGRKRMPDFSVRLAIGTDWQNIHSDNDLDKYRELLQRYPDFELGQLYTIINEQLKGNRS